MICQIQKGNNCTCIWGVKWDLMGKTDRFFFLIVRISVGYANQKSKLEFQNDACRNCYLIIPLKWDCRGSFRMQKSWWAQYCSPPIAHQPLTVGRNSAMAQAPLAQLASRGPACPPLLIASSQQRFWQPLPSIPIAPSHGWASCWEKQCASKAAQPLVHPSPLLPSLLSCFRSHSNTCSPFGGLLLHVPLLAIQKRNLLVRAHLFEEQAPILPSPGRVNAKKLW